MKSCKRPSDFTDLIEKHDNLLRATVKGSYWHFGAKNIFLTYTRKTFYIAEIYSVGSQRPAFRRPTVFQFCAENWFAFRLFK